MLPILKASRELKNWYFTVNFLSQHHLYGNNTCIKFQGQKIHQKKDIQNLPTRVAVRKFSLLSNLTPSQRLKFFFPWKFWNNKFCMLITYLQISRPKDQYKKIFTIYLHVSFWETIVVTISLLPTLTPSQGLKNCLFTMKFLSQYDFYVNNMCAKFQGKKFHTKKDILNLPTSIAVRNHFTTAFFYTLPRAD